MTPDELARMVRDRENALYLYRHALDEIAQLRATLAALVEAGDAWLTYEDSIRARRVETPRRTMLRGEHDAARDAARALLNATKAL